MLFERSLNLALIRFEAKLGCPLSPKLFVHLLHQALLLLQQGMPELFLAQGDRIILPCLRIYADDILAIITDPTQTTRLHSLIGPCRQEFGLELNVAKNEVLVWDPFDSSCGEPSRQVRFGLYFPKVVSRVKNLGTVISDEINDHFSSFSITEVCFLQFRNLGAN